MGINTAIFSPSGGSVGIGFSVPSNTAKNVISQLIQYGETRRGWLGVKIQAVTDEIAESLNLPNTHGALVSDVTPGGPAEKAGFEAGDIISESICDRAASNDAPAKWCKRRHGYLRCWDVGAAVPIHPA
jgi:serine protease Do